MLATATFCIEEKSPLSSLVWEGGRALVALGVGCGAIAV
jgi:hypothetical protein